MGKKSRRQRDKDSGPQIPQPSKVPPVMRGTIRKTNGVRAFLAGSITPESLNMILERHKVRHTALRLFGTKRMYSYTDDEWEKNQRVWAMRNAIVASHPEDELALDEYLCAVVGNQFFQMGFGLSHKNRPFNQTLKYLILDEAAVARWPRVKPHWRRFRRRLCTNCHNHAHLSEPRYLVCSACGVARYCSEACQAADWPTHQGECCGVGGLPGVAEFERLLGEAGISMEEARRHGYGEGGKKL